MGYSVRLPWYRSFINATTPAGTVGGHGVPDIAAWATSCLISQEAALHWCGWGGPPPKNGSGFYEVLGALHVHEPGPYLPGDLIYWANTGTDGHVACLLEIRDDGTWVVAGGGGGRDGRESSISELVGGKDPYGRRRQGAWRPSRLIQ